MTAYYNFARKTPYNNCTHEQLWISSFNDSHDAFCGCTKPVTHMLSILFPEGHRDLDLTIRQILQREKEDTICLFGGTDERDGGEAQEDPGTKEKDIPDATEEEFTKIDVEDLLAAAADADTPSGEVPTLKKHKLQIPASKVHMLCPVSSKKNYKSLIQQSRKQQQCSTAGTTGEDLLHSQLLKEFAKTNQLIQISKQVQSQANLSRKRKRQQKSYHTHQKRKKSSRNVSSHSTKKVSPKKSHKHKTCKSSSSSSSSNSNNSSTTFSKSSQNSSSSSNY
ncbi:hypothetical protein [Torque teno midi virus 9]|uniref:Uncharacterized protein n=1 Tax=Torque teno midi virus 9 TaxID=2065050 RepID=A7VLY2_9VIRU|nr:hypothetical protein [Torque teno midi virus 9]BAF76103.1 hypothetical protein [Torque teno midi virus 9]